MHGKAAATLIPPVYLSVVFQPSDFSISLKAVGKNKHFKVQLLDAVYCIGQRRFSSMDELVEHYKKAPIFTSEQGDKLYLVKPLAWICHCFNGHYLSLRAPPFPTCLSFFLFLHTPLTLLKRMKIGSFPKQLQGLFDISEPCIASTLVGSSSNFIILLKRDSILDMCSVLFCFFLSDFQPPWRF